MNYYEIYDTFRNWCINYDICGISVQFDHLLHGSYYKLHVIF